MFSAAGLRKTYPPKHGSASRARKGVNIDLNGCRKRAAGANEKA